MKEKPIAKGIKIADLALFIEKPKTLVISDLQLGYEGTMNRQGTMLPRFNFEEIKKRLENKILNKARAKKILINGDLKHEFGKTTEQEWKEILSIFELLKKHCKEIIIVKGNHDVSLGQIAKWENIETKKEYFLEKEKILITHGDKISHTEEMKKAKTVILGHEHPAITIREGAKTEKFKCFLKGKFHSKTLIVQPAMSAIATGTDILQGNHLSPFLKHDISSFEVWAVEDKPYYFGRIKEIQKNY